MLVKLSFLLILCTFCVITYFYRNRCKTKKYFNKIINKKIIKVNGRQSYVLKMKTSFWIVPVDNNYATSKNIFGIKKNGNTLFFNKTCDSVFTKNDTIEIVNYFSDKDQLFYCFFLEGDAF